MKARRDRLEAGTLVITSPATRMVIAIVWNGGCWRLIKAPFLADAIALLYPPPRATRQSRQQEDQRSFPESSARAWIGVGPMSYGPELPRHLSLGSAATLPLPIPRCESHRAGWRTRCVASGMGEGLNGAGSADPGRGGAPGVVWIRLDVGRLHDVPRYRVAIA
jgi:hypothetical protein